jgi:Mn2+/Fe2+ NRAMP family transporter
MKKHTGILGAAFLMATSAIGPGFLNNTAVFTGQMLTSFGFIVLVSVLVDIGAQVNIWRIITVSKLRAQEIGNKMFSGLGTLLACLVAFGGLVFNIGNIAGCGMGLQILTGLEVQWGAIISCIISILIFSSKNVGKVLDWVVKITGVAMILLTAYIAFSSHPPVLKSLQHTFWPEEINLKMIIALVGGTVGGYISFAGAHRLLDGGISGLKNVKAVTRSANTGILLAAVMRYILFLAVLGMVWHGGTLDSQNPAASVFQYAAGNIGYLFFGVVLWLASITSVIGASYTSVSFLKTLHPKLATHSNRIIIVFILISALVFLLLRESPVKLLVAAGVLNGFILPIALATMLLALSNKKLFPDYHHPRWLYISGWFIVLIMTWMSISVIVQ